MAETWDACRAEAVCRACYDMASFSKRRRTVIAAPAPTEFACRRTDDVDAVTEIHAIRNWHQMNSKSSSSSSSINYARASPNSHRNDVRITTNNSCPSFRCASHFSMHTTGAYNGRFVFSVCDVRPLWVCVVYALCFCAWEVRASEQ